MPRALSIRNLYDKKFEVFEFDGVWRKIFGDPETRGCWIIYGIDKNGKTWFALKLAKYLSKFRRVMYVSAEEGTSKTFVEACERASLNASDNMQVLEYLELEELDKKLKKRKAPRIIFIDNITIYSDELKYGGLRKFLQTHSDKLIIFIAHEERNEPFTAQAKLVRKLAQIIMRIKGLTAFISGRCPGGEIEINEKAQLFHGSELVET